MTRDIYSVTAKDLVTGELPEINSDMLMPTASTFKVFVLYEMMRQCQEGVLSLGQVHVLKEEDFCPGSGVLKELTPGIPLTLRDLACLMVIISDNTATDILVEKTDISNLSSTLKSLGLASTSIHMGCRHTGSCGGHKRALSHTQRGQRNRDAA